MVDTTINNDLNIYGNEINIPYIFNVTADYAQYGKGVIATTDGIAEMSVNGTFFNPLDVKPSKYTPVTFPVRDPNGKTTQGYLSEYTPNTLLEAAYDTGSTMDIQTLLDKFNVTVNTTDFAQVIPELATKYGAGVPVDIKAKFITKESHITMSSTTNQADANVAFTLTVAGEEAIYAEFNGVQAIGQVSSSLNKIFGAFTTHNIGAITVTSFRSSITGMTAASLQAELQTVVDTNVATLNAELAAGIEFPTIFNASITGLDANCHDGYISGGIDITPAGFEMLRDLMVSAAQEIRYIRRLNRIEEINKSYYAARATVM